MSLASNVLSDAASWALLVGFLAPIVIQLITSRIASAQYQAVAAFAFCVVAGAGTAYFAGDLTSKSAVSAVLVVLVTALTTYEGLWKPLGVTPKTATK